MLTHMQYRLLAALRDTALDAATDADRLAKGRLNVGTESIEAFLDVLKEAVADARAGSVLATDIVHRLYAGAIGPIEGQARTVTDLFELVDQWVERCQAAAATKNPEELRRFMTDALAVHAYALSRSFAA